MAYDRFDERRRDRDQRRHFDHDREERGWFDRARDEVTSWFGDEGDDDRHERGGRERFEAPRSAAPRSSERDYERFDRSPRWRDEGPRRPYTGRSAGRPADDGDRYRPMTGDYGRSSDFERDYNRAQAQSNERFFDRGQSQQPPASASSASSASGMHDRDYVDWRSRQISELDSDYDEFRRENSSRFETEFSSWRQTRQSKKQLVQQLSEHMEVVGADNEPVGKIDHIKGDRIILTKADSPDGRHHVVGCSRFDKIEDGKLVLDQPASQIQQSFEEQKRTRALFEEERPDDSGPHMLNRSFSGTY